jgi:serine-type D-Ala-D-Ala carboxypeptidase/endopeptidase (penicillin-binding protein 4)
LILCVSLTAACAKPRPALPSPSPVNPLERLRADISAAVQMPGVQRGAWGIAVHSLTSDERLFELNARTLLVPASASKLVSVASAAEAVGWDYRFETTLRGTGPIADGTLHGDLLVAGSGDPSIGGRAGDDLGAFVDALKALGIRRIDGRVIGDDDAIEEPRPQLAWAWDDLGYATGAIFGALNLTENRMQVTVSPGAHEGSPTTLGVEPHAAYRPLANRTVTGAAGSTPLVWPEQRPGDTFLTIAGSVPAGATPARLTVSAGNPTFWFASVLRHRLLKDGIEVTGEAFDVDDVIPAPDRATSMVLYTYKSPSLAAIAQPLLKESINLYGEAFFRLNAPPGSFPTNDAALEGLRTRLASWGVPPDGQQLVDGSGLSRRNVISPETLLIVLRRMAAGGTTGPFMTALPLAGTDGSLAGRMTGTAAHANVRAKTGTMSNVRALAGYVTTRDGEPLAFVIMVNNFEGPGAAALKAIDAIAVRLADFSREKD